MKSVAKFDRKIVLELPETVDPGRVCICFEIPNERYHIRAFWSVLQRLTDWKNWQPDAGKNGTKVAAVWRDVLAVAYEETRVNMGCGCDEKRIVRQWYTEDGVLMVEYGDGATEPRPDLDIRETSPEFPPLPGLDGEDKKCAAAASVVRVVDQDFIQLMNEGDTSLQILAIIVVLMAIFLSAGTLAPLVMTMIYAIISFGVSATKSAFTAEVWGDFQCILYCRMEDDASFTDEGWEYVKDDVFSQFAGSIVQTVLGSVVNAAGSVGLTNMARSGAVESADCMDCQCGDLNCGFNATPTLNKNRWIEATELFDPATFDRPLRADFTPTNIIAFAGGTQTLAMKTVFEDPCYVTNVGFNTLGRMNGSIINVAYRLVAGGTWMSLDLRSIPTWAAGAPQVWAINNAVVEIQFQSMNNVTGQNNISSTTVGDPTP